MNYILDSKGRPKEESDTLKWCQWYETADRTVKKDTIGDVLISTVFLAIDHQFGKGPPILYETMIFGGEHNDHQERYTNEVAALAGHDQAVAMVRDGLRQDDRD